MPSPAKKSFPHHVERQILILAAETPKRDLMKNKPGDEWIQPAQAEVLDLIHGPKRSTNQDIAKALCEMYDDKHLRVSRHSGIQYSDRFVQAFPKPTGGTDTPTRIARAGAAVEEMKQDIAQLDDPSLLPEPTDEEKISSPPR